MEEEGKKEMGRRQEGDGRKEAGRRRWEGDRKETGGRRREEGEWKNRGRRRGEEGEGKKRLTRSLQSFRTSPVEGLPLQLRSSKYLPANISLSAIVFYRELLERLPQVSPIKQLQE
ncbi:hypothetical protein NE237_027168 [Protea cynaroides]|uniref:Uncharacterized protein n=1 Tax=Protea cynaroides TaxID=273540 RepID=A0A9Q0GNT5_9MAGN|nr:hypothetical protein NE237_027168 [Protea cynaroides]